MLPIHTGRRTQVVKGEVCKTSMQRSVNVSHITKNHDSFLTVLHPEAAFQVSDRRLKPPALFGRKKIPESSKNVPIFPSKPSCSVPGLFLE